MKGPTWLHATTGLVLLASLSGCCSTRSYQGDGRFTDSCGTPSWHLWDWNRYVLDLGALDLATTGEHRFRIGSLPRARTWLIGLNVEPLATRPAEAVLDEAVVELVMTNRDGQLVLSQSRPLHMWGWAVEGGHGTGIGPAFVSLVGEQREIPIGGGDTRGEVVGVRAEGGWGTHFRPARNSGYELVVRIVTPDPEAGHFEVHLQARGSNYGGSL